VCRKITYKKETKADIFLRKLNSSANIRHWADQRSVAAQWIYMSGTFIKRRSFASTLGCLRKQGRQIHWKRNMKLSRRKLLESIAFHFTDL